MSIEEAPRSGTDSRPRDLLQARELLSSYGQAVGALLGVFALVTGMGVVLIGLFSILAAADPATGQVDVFKGFVELMQQPAWVMAEGNTVMRYQVLTGLIVLMAWSLTVLISACLATLLQATFGNEAAASRTWKTALFISF